MNSIIGLDFVKKHTIKDLIGGALIVGLLMLTGALKYPSDLSTILFVLTLLDSWFRKKTSNTLLTFARVVITGNFLYALFALYTTMNYGGIFTSFTLALILLLGIAVNLIVYKILAEITMDRENSKAFEIRHYTKLIFTSLFLVVLMNILIRRGF